MLEGYVLLHTLDYLWACLTGEEETAEISAHLHYLSLIQHAGVERYYVALRDCQSQALDERQPCAFLKDKPWCSDAECPFCLFAVGNQLAYVLWTDIVLNGLWGNPTAPLSWTNHSLQSVFLFLQQTLGLIVLFLFGERLKRGVEIRLWTFIHKHLVSAILLEDKNDFWVHIQWP